MAGRPTLFDQGKADEILVAVRRGMTFKAAAAAAGITYRTMHNWEERGKAEILRVNEAIEAGLPAKSRKTRKAEEPFVKFYMDLQQARASGEFTLADIIYSAANGGAVLKETKTVQWTVAGVVVKEQKTTIEKEIGPDWRAAAFMAERRHNWTNRTDNLNIDFSTLTDDEVERIAAGENPVLVLADRLEEAKEGEE